MMFAVTVVLLRYHVFVFTWMRWSHIFHDSDLDYDQRFNHSSETFERVSSSYHCISCTKRKKKRAQENSLIVWQVATCFLSIRGFAYRLARKFCLFVLVRAWVQFCHTESSPPMAPMSPCLVCNTSMAVGDHLPSRCHTYLLITKPNTVQYYV